MNKRAIVELSLAPSKHGVYNLENVECIVCMCILKGADKEKFWGRFLAPLFSSSLRGPVTDEVLEPTNIMMSKKSISINKYIINGFGR